MRLSPAAKRKMDAHGRRTEHEGPRGADAAGVGADARGELLEVGDVVEHFCSSKMCVRTWAGADC
jgi:hypothetical protein